MDIFKLAGSILIDTKKADESLKKTSDHTDSFVGKLGNGVKAAGKFAAGVGTAAVGAAGFLLKMATNASESMDAIQKGAQKMEMSYEGYQKLSYALDRSGASIDDLKKGMENIKGDLQDFANGAEGASETYDKLGISMKNTDGTMKSTEQIMQESLMALADMDDTMQRDAIASEIFGKSYTNLIPLLDGGSESIKDLMQNAEDLGLVFGDDAVDSGAQFGDMLEDTKESLMAVVTQLSIQLFPVIMQLMDWIMTHMPEIQEFLGQFFEVCGQLVNMLVDVIVAVGPSVEKLWNGVVMPVLQAIISFIQFTFNGGITSALDSIQAKIEGWWQKATEPFRKFGEAVGSIWEALKAKFKLPHFSISGSLNPIDWITNGGMPKLAVEWYAKGGIVNDPTVVGVNGNRLMVAGEAGPEAIAPIAELEKYMTGSSKGVEQKLDQLISLLSAYLPSIEEKSGVTITGSAADIFKVVRDTNDRIRKSTGFNPLVG